jgi:predicted transcriptional regulator
MPNIKRKWADYTYDLSPEQMEGLLEIALKKDEPIQALVQEAIGQYIERELPSCRTET